jgi:hypothetical protein
LGVDEEDILAGAQALPAQALSLETTSSSRRMLRIEDLLDSASDQDGERRA